jgi:hypothetical protein
MVKKITLKNINEIQKLVRDEVLIEAIEEQKAILPMPSSFAYSIRGKILLLGQMPKVPEIHKPQAPAAETGITENIVSSVNMQHEIGQNILCENGNVTEVYFSDSQENKKKYYLINRKDIVLILQ